MIVNAMRSGSRRRRQCYGPPSALARRAERLIRLGVPVRLAVAWNHSFHDAAYTLVLRYGPAIRRPMSADEIRRALRADAESARVREAIRRWELSRRA